MNNLKKLKKFFTILIVSYPVLYIYASPFKALSIADLLLIIIDAFLIFYSIKNGIKKINKPLLIFIFLSLIQVLFLLLVDYNEYSKIIMSTTRILLYVFSLCFFGESYFDKVLAIKCIKKIAIFASIYLLVQTVFLRLFHIYIPGTIPFMAEYDQNLTIFELIMKNNPGYTYRARSIFLEPSHYAIYIALALMIELMKNGKKDFFSIIFLSFSMIVSGSSTAILMIPICFIISIIFNQWKITKKRLFQSLIAMVFIVIIGGIYFKTDSFMKFYDRTFISGGATTNRIENYSLVFENSDNNFITKFFGHGIYKIEEYIPSVPRIYYYYGLVGFILFLIITIFSLYNTDKLGKSIILILIVLCFASELLFSHFILPYFIFIINSKKGKVNKNEFKQITNYSYSNV